jgi:hypothetical protein
VYFGERRELSLVVHTHAAVGSTVERTTSRVAGLVAHTQ